MFIKTKTYKIEPKVNFESHVTTLGRRFFGIDCT